MEDRKSSKSQSYLTLREVAKSAGLEESQVRYYETLFGELLPEKIQKADQALFTDGHVERFSAIHRWLKAGFSQQEITDHLRQGVLPPPHVPASLDKPRRADNMARVIAVASGKGGVGKTNLSVNLAIELQKRGRNCILVDVDLGLANAHIVAGVAPPVTLIDVTEGVYSLAEVIVEGPAGIGMIAGGSGVLELANLPGYKRTQLLMELEKIEQKVDYIILDMGSGISSNVLDFMSAADACLVVTTPDITAITDAYGMLKVLNRYGVASRAGVICNQVSSAAQGKEIFSKLQTCCSRFLDFSPRYWGHVFKDSSVGKATAERTPYTLSYPYGRASRSTSLIAESLYREPIAKKESSFKIMRSATAGA